MSKKRPVWGSKKRLHAALKRLRERVLAGERLYLGICHNLSAEMRNDGGDICTSNGYEAVEYYSPSWPKYSGRVCCPIPGEYNPAYNWVGEQRELRLSLINHMLRKTR